MSNKDTKTTKTTKTNTNTLNTKKSNIVNSKLKETLKTAKDTEKNDLIVKSNKNDVEMEKTLDKVVENANSIKKSNTKTCETVRANNKKIIDTLSSDIREDLNNKIAFILSLYQKSNTDNKDIAVEVTVSRFDNDIINLNIFCENGHSVSSNKDTPKNTLKYSDLINFQDKSEIVRKENCVVIPKIKTTGLDVRLLNFTLDYQLNINLDTHLVDNKFNNKTKENFHKMLSNFFRFIKTDTVKFEIKTRKGTTNIKIKQTLSKTILNITVGTQVYENDKDFDLDGFLDYLESDGIKETILDTIYDKMS